MKSIPATLFLFLVLLSGSFGTIITVPGDASTIQAAIEATSTGDTVLVAPGTYYENIRFLGKGITVASHFILEEDPSYILSTTINGSQPEHADTASCVLFINGEDSTSVLAGFTLTGGTGTVWEDEHNLNHWYTEGGGILIQYASPTIRNNIILFNQATAMPQGVTSAGGGAIRSGDSNPHIINNIIMHNQGRYGGGIVLNYSGAVIRNNIIAGNSGGEDYGGGGIWILGNSPDHPRILENNTIVNNHADQWGGGLRLIYTTVQATNCIFWGNTASSSNQIQGASIELSYSAVEGGFSGTNILEDDPQFVGGLFMLDSGSPCIDAGNPESQYNDPEDLQQPGMAMYPAQGTVTSDIGVYGGPGAALFPELATAVNELFGKPTGLSLGLYPNPVGREQGYVTVSNQSDESVSISLITMHGQRLEGFLHILTGGETAALDLQGLGAGLYFVAATSVNGNSLMRKLVIH